MNARNTSRKNIATERIRVRGLVQGVGFRPFIWRLARACRLTGEVVNDAGGVLIQVAGPAARIDDFVARLQAEAPQLARIDTVERRALRSALTATDFTIRKSPAGGEVRTTGIPDAATCTDCRKEIFDPANRRYHYPFTNCTNCGPRLSITRALPYDRAHTSMADFPMCPACRREYDDPADRRFHAQPNACADCGPTLWLTDGEGERLLPPEGETVLSQAADLLNRGKIVAVKGLGGFHLACDAADNVAVERLRRRKKRPDKPLAVMVADLAMAERHVLLDEPSRSLLVSPSAPIVLLEKRQDGDPLADQLAPGQNRLGVMLPYTPLHHLLMSRLDRPIVLTSGNRSNEPQVTGNEEALKRLAGIADVWLMHDRDIVNRLDDSLVQLVAGVPQILRRARGHAPRPFVLPEGFREAPAVLAMGGELKNTFCLLKNGQALVSQHIGDLENPATHRDYRKNLRLYFEMNDFAPARIAVDHHPDYFSTRLGGQLAHERSCPLDEVQHHHAHIAACLAEHGREPDQRPVLGVVFDGLGYGADGGLWGGEFLLADYVFARRLAHLPPVALPGGELAHRQPWRNSFAHLLAAFGNREFEHRYGDVAGVKWLRTRPLDQMQQMIERGLNSPPASSAGRLFDGVAALLGLCPERVGFEGQAAMALQALAERAEGAQAGRYDISTGADICLRPLWSGLLDDLQQGVGLEIIAARFHNSLMTLICETVLRLAGRHGVSTLVLTGGVFQNTVLLSGVKEKLRREKLTILSPQRFPANDGGLSLGQAVVSAARALQGG